MPTKAIEKTHMKNKKHQVRILSVTWLDLDGVGAVPVVGYQRVSYSYRVGNASVFSSKSHEPLFTTCFEVVPKHVPDSSRLIAHHAIREAGRAVSVETSRHSQARPL